MPVTVKVEAASSTVESTEAEEAKAESEEREEAETEAESTGAAVAFTFFSYEYCSWWSKGTSRVIALRASIGLCSQRKSERSLVRGSHGLIHVQLKNLCGIHLFSVPKALKHFNFPLASYESTR